MMRQGHDGLETRPELEEARDEAELALSWPVRLLIMAVGCEMMALKGAPREKQGPCCVRLSE